MRRYLTLFVFYNSNNPLKSFGSSNSIFYSAKPFNILKPFPDAGLLTEFNFFSVIEPIYGLYTGPIQTQFRYFATLTRE